jgi:hypothetical protein
LASKRKVKTTFKKSGLGVKKPRVRFLKDGSVKESVIQADILRWLKSTGLMFWRSNSGSLFLRGRHINLGPLGCADISVVVPPLGRFVGLEVKSANGKIRKDQIAYAAGLTQQGGAYFIVRSVQDAKDAIAQVLGEAEWKSRFGPRLDY